MDKDKLRSFAEKVKNASVDGAAKVVSSVSDGTTKDAAKKMVNNRIDDVKMYTAESINAAEGFLEEHDAAGKLQKAVDKVGSAYEALKAGSDKVADHFTNDHFDEQTSEIRDELARQKDADTDDEDDIVIDATSDSDGQRAENESNDDQSSSSDNEEKADSSEDSLEDEDQSDPKDQLNLK